MRKYQLGLEIIKRCSRIAITVLPSLFILSSCDDLLGNDDVNKDEINFIVSESDYYKKLLLSKSPEDSRKFGNNYLSHQSLAVFGPYAFAFEEGDKCMVFDLNVNEPISLLQLPVSGHASNVQFIREYYSPNDEFPLLLYTNDNHNLSILRIQKFSNAFKCDLVKSISIDFNGIDVRALVAFTDYDRNKLCFLYTTTAGWSEIMTGDDDVVNLIEFDFISLFDENIKMIDLKKGKFINKYPFFVLQGVDYSSGKYIFASQLRHYYWTRDYKAKSFVNSLLIVDSKSGNVNGILYTNSSEPEGVSIVNKELYFSVRETRSVQNETCFWLYKYNLFNLL